jgi:hypothetical protein
MRTLRLLLILLLFPVLSRAASPSFNSFLPTWFTNNGIVIGLNTNMVITWQMVSTNSFTTNGNSLAINTNTFPTLPVVLDIVNTTSNQLSTNTWTTLLTNIYRMSGKVMIGTTNHAQNAKFIVNSSGLTYSALFTNPVSGTWAAVGTESSPNGASYYQAVSVGTGAGIMSANGGSVAYMELIARSNAVGQTTVLLANQDNRFFTYSPASGGIISFIITNNSPNNSLVIGLDGIVRFKATGGGIEFPDSTRQFTSATNAVRIFGLGGITASPSNNTANGSIDYRISSTGDTNFPHVVVTNGVLYGTSLWAASSDSTNYVLTLSTNAERTINMTANVRVVGVAALAPAGFRGFVGVTVTNNSGSTFTVETTNTFRPYGTNSFSVPSGKDARIVFQIDENRVFYGGTVTP